MRQTVVSFQETLLEAVVFTFGCCAIGIVCAVIMFAHNPPV
jgi:hypothetical protein